MMLGLMLLFGRMCVYVVIFVVLLLCMFVKMCSVFVFLLLMLRCVWVFLIISMVLCVCRIV